MNRRRIMRYPPPPNIKILYYYIGERGIRDEKTWGKMTYFVKCKRYGDSFNTWILREDVTLSVSIQTPWINFIPDYIAVTWPSQQSIFIYSPLGWEPIITNLLCHQLVRSIQTLFFSVLSCMLLHANGTHWVNILERQILINSGRVLKQCYLHNNMDAERK